MTLYEISVYFCKLVCVYIEHTLHSTAQDIHSFIKIANLSSVYVMLKAIVYLYKPAIVCPNDSWHYVLERNSVH